MVAPAVVVAVVEHDEVLVRGVVVDLGSSQTAPRGAETPVPQRMVLSCSIGTECSYRSCWILAQ